MISVLGDFNTKSNNWWRNDTTSYEGSLTDVVKINYGLHQIIQESTHIFNTSSFCIDQIFTSQPNLVMESGVHSSLHPNCHHHVVFAKFNFLLILILIFCIDHLTKELFGFIKKQTLNLSEELLMNLIG